jgi:RNA polymerase sigma-70 factor, ECF subfamily
MTVPMERPRLATQSGQAHELAPLFSAIGAGDHATLSLLYRRTSAKLYGICMRILKNEEDAAEVLQDVFVSVWRNAARFDPARASPITWLAVLARNRAIDRLRGRKIDSAPIEAAHDVPSTDPSALDMLSASQETGRLADCLQELDERPRAMIRAAFLDGATYSQLSARENVPLGTMKSWIRRGLQRLKGCLER